MRNTSLAFTIVGSLGCGSYPVTAEILMGLSDSCEWLLPFGKLRYGIRLVVMRN